MTERFGDEEIGVIRTVFDSYDIEREGRIHINQLTSMLFKLGKQEEEIANMTQSASRIADEQEGKITFNDVIGVIRQHDNAKQVRHEGVDPKVLEFLRILEEYRVKCEEEGSYLEASRSHKQLEVLRKQEERRQQKVIQARHISERQDVQLAHNLQYTEFNKAWDKYLEEYDQMAQMYIQQMTERHSIVLLEYQKKLREELAAKPPKWSRALMDTRRKQHINARNKNYSVAQKLKKISDIHEERERKAMELNQATAFTRKEAQFRVQQQTELTALLKRIECRRKEHIKQRELDTKRLLQRNRNVQAVLEGKQAAECQKLFAQIKKVLYSSAVLGNTGTRRNGASNWDTKQSNGNSNNNTLRTSRSSPNKVNFNNNDNNFNGQQYASSGGFPSHHDNYQYHNNTYSGGHQSHEPDGFARTTQNMNADNGFQGHDFDQNDHADYDFQLEGSRDYDDNAEKELNKKHFQDLVYNGAEDESINSGVPVQAN